MTDTPELTVGRAVDWRFATTVGARLARPAPPSTDYTRRQAVEELHTAAQTALPLVAEVTGLSVRSAVTPATRVVDRPGWIAAAAESMRVMTGGTDKPRGFISSRLAGAQTGAVLAFISSSILGQYDPFADDGAGALLLVSPNVIAVERQLRVEPADFRLWVCLHEVTHRVQFTANPWLPDHMAGALAVLTGDAGDDFTDVVGRLAEFARSRRDPDPATTGILGMVRALQSAPQREALDQLLVLGTLLEGHADHVMDGVGPDAVPSVATIRRRFDDRRKRKQPPLQRLLRALLGIDAKLSQYTRGKAFVDHVVQRVGMDRFNTVWSGPQTLPLPAEIENPEQWIARVL